MTETGTFTHSEILTIITGLMLGMFLAALDQTIVSTAIRTIADDLNGFSLQAWATTAFLITSTISTPLYGKLSDMFGRRQFFLTAIVVFIVGSALCGFAQSMYQLAIFRAIQGLGAGGLFPLAIAIVGDIVPPQQRARYQGYFMAVFGTSSVLGPVIGGLLAGSDTIFGIAGWRWIFYVNIPVGAVALIVVFRVLHLPHTRREHRIDFPGAAALVLCLVPLLTVAEQGREWGWNSGRALSCYALGLLGLILFIVAERWAGDEALIPPRMFKSRTFSIGTAGSAIVGIGMFGALGLLPLYLQVVKGSSPTVAGLQTLPLVLGIMSAALFAGRAISKNGKYKRFPVMGTAIMVISLILLSLVNEGTSLAFTMPVMFVFGTGLGMNMQPLVLAVQNAVSPRDIGVATSSVTFARSLGGTVGVAVFLSILFSTLVPNISSAVAEARPTPAFQQALADHPDQAALLEGGGQGALTDTSFITKLDSRIGLPFKAGFSDSMDLIFRIAAAALFIAFILQWFLPELPLRKQSGLQAQADPSH